MSVELRSEVLVVDDSPTVVAMVAGRLERAGFSVTAAHDGQTALDLLEGAQFDLVLLDIAMPGLSGLEVLRTLRETRDLADLPVIMTSALDEATDVVQALELGANDYVTKPVNFPILLARMRTQLTLRRAVGQIRQLERDLEQRNQALEETNQRLKSAHRRVMQGVQAAARIQQSLLPSEPPDTPGVRFAWLLRSCEELAGDLLNVVKLSPTAAACYVLDVSGHGVPASLLSVSLHKLLSAPTESTSILVAAGEGGATSIVPPAEVAASLNRLFPMDPTALQYFTLVYGILDLETREFRYVSAGHPGPVQCMVSGTQMVHDSTGLPIGWDEAAAYVEGVIQLGPGDRLYLYSDGIPEAFGPGGEDQFGQARLLETLDRGRSKTLEESLGLLIAALQEWSGEKPLKDDASVLALEIVAET
ncbi:MAG TPA: SpoIIE family protein phosphatase [bacterium]|nr:SpoIIE family protein phosphatase [bacterium]